MLNDVEIVREVNFKLKHKLDFNKLLKMLNVLI